MPIPNVATLYQKIGKGSEGGHEFARFVKMLLGADFSLQNRNFISESDASGDYKSLDAYIPGDDDFPELIDGFQFKFYPANLTTSQQNEISKSIEKALAANEFIQTFTLITPEDFLKIPQAWFDSLKMKYEKFYWVESAGLHRKAGFKLFHWGHTKLIELALKYDHIGVHYYPELYPLGVGKFKLSKALMDSELTVWRPSKHNTNGYYMTSACDDDQVTDPVFDFQFKNSTDEIHLLNRIELHIEEVWTTLKGIPADKFLKSIGTIEYEVDFSQSINTIVLFDPMIFAPNQPQRFKIQLNNFQPPGNWVRLKFWFYFDEVSIPTDSFLLSL